MTGRADNWERYAATLVTWGLRDPSVNDLPKMYGDSDLPYDAPAAHTGSAVPSDQPGAA